MKTKKSLLVLPAIALVFALVFAACSNGSTGGGGGGGGGDDPIPKSAMYVVYDRDEYKYELVISGTVTGNASYQPKKGDSYKLTITKTGSETKTSTGTVDKVVSNQWNVEITLKSGSNTLTAWVDVEEENGRAAITGWFWLSDDKEIPLDDGNTIEPPDIAYEPTKDGAGFILLKGVDSNGVAVIPATFLGKPVTELGIGAFANNTDLKSVTIPVNITRITGWGAFENCTNLTSVTFASGSKIEIIPGGTFAGCTSLTTITIPASVIEISAWGSFQDCTSLTTVNFAAGSKLKIIGGGAFFECTSLKNITIPASVTAIGANGGWDTFFNCTSIDEIIIPAGVKYVGPEAFGGWTDSQKIKIQGGYDAVAGWAEEWNWTEATILYWDEDEKNYVGGGRSPGGGAMKPGAP